RCAAVADAGRAGAAGAAPLHVERSGAGDLGAGGLSARPCGDHAKGARMTVWHYPASARQFRPWKNGGGETAEIAVSPAGAGFDDFDWRISTAIVAQSGPFSGFPGVDRVLTVIEGGAMELTVAGEARHLDAG